MTRLPVGTLGEEHMQRYKGYLKFTRTLDEGWEISKELGEKWRPSVAPWLILLILVERGEELTRVFVFTDKILNHIKCAQSHARRTSLDMSLSLRGQG